MADLFSMIPTDDTILVRNREFEIPLCILLKIKD